MTNFIPKLSTQAGACLTMANWQEINISCVAYSLSALLIKPGLDLLRKCGDLKTYFGWQNQFVLNASELSIDEQGKCYLRSNFDGGHLRFDFADLISLMVQWAPDYVVLPRNFPSQLLSLCTPIPKNITFFLHVEASVAWENYPYFGVYVDESASDSAQHLQRFQHRLKYVMSAYPITSYAALLPNDIAFIESDKPALDAMHGSVYVAKECISLADATQSMKFEVIDKSCQCPTCEQQLSRAYLCHLYAHTPLLCQRFLIQHNVFQTQSEIFKAFHLPCL